MKKIILFILFTVSLLQAQNDILLLYDSGGIDTIPSQFNFVDVTNAAQSTMDTSLAVTLTGFDSAWCYAAGQSFAVNAGAFRTAGIKVYRNDLVYVRRTSSASCNTAVTVILTVGNKSDTWSLTTVKSEPNTFVFTDVILSELSTLTISDSIIVAGLECASTVMTISGTGGTYRKGILGSFTATAGTVSNTDTVWLRNTSSSECLAGVNTTLTIGDSSNIWSITTKSSPPPMFDPSDDFPAYSKSAEINPNTVYASDSIVVTQIICPLSLSIDGDGNPEYRKGVNGAWTDVNGTVAADDTLWVRLTSSPLYNTAVECTLHVDKGNVDIWLQFLVTTDMEDNIHPPFILTTVDDADTSTVYQTSTVVTGVNVPIAVQVGGSGDYYGYKIHYNGSWATADGIVELGDTVFVRNISSNIFSGQTVAILTLDGSPASFTINSIACDSLPTLTPSDFVDVTNAELSTPYYTDSMIVTGLTGCTPQISISSSGLAQYKVGYCEQEGCWMSTPSAIANGDTVWVVGFSSDEYSTPVFTTLTIGETPVSWTITTKEEMPPGMYLTTENGEYLLLDNDKYLIIDEEPQ